VSISFSISLALLESYFKYIRTKSFFFSVCKYKPQHGRIFDPQLFGDVVHFQKQILKLVPLRSKVDYSANCRMCTKSSKSKKIGADRSTFIILGERGKIEYLRFAKANRKGRSDLQGCAHRLRRTLRALDKLIALQLTNLQGFERKFEVK